MQAASTLTLAFAAALLATLGTKFWLASRQIRHVARHRGAVPAAFAGKVSLEAHQRAADYTIAKLRFGLLTTAFGAAVLLGWTLLSGLDALNQWLMGLLGPGMAQQLALAVHNSHLASEVAEKEALKRTLEQARLIQRSMLPDTELPLAEIPWPPLAHKALKERYGVLQPITAYPVHKRKHVEA